MPARNNGSRLKYIYFFCVVLVLAVIIGSVYLYPDIRFILESGKQYKGIGFTGTPEEMLYLSRINGVYKGSCNLSDIYCFEHQSDPWFRPFIGELIIGNIGKMLGINVVNLDILMSAVLNIILAFLVFIFAYQLSKSVKLSIVCSFAVMFGYYIFSANIGILKEIFISRTYAMPLWFLRPISPQFYYIPFFIALIFIHRAICVFPDNNKDRLIAGIVLGVLFYCNIYYWTFIYAGLGILMLMYFILKDKKKILSIALIYLISLLVAAPYMLSVFNVINHPNYEYLQKVYSIFNSRRFFFYAPYFIPATIVSALLLAFKHPSRFFLVSFLIGGMACLNHQILTGKNFIQQWAFYSNKTFLIISIIMLVQLLFSHKIKAKFTRYGKFINNTSLRRLLFFVAVLFFTLVAFSHQNNYYHLNKKFFLEKQKLAGAYNWLMRNKNKNEAVITDPFCDPSDSLKNYRLLLTYTNKYSYIAEQSQMLISDDEIFYRVLSALLILGYGDDDIEEYINNIKLTFLSTDPNIMIYPPSKEYFEMIRSMYKKLKNLSPADMFNKYKVDYILIENKIAFKMDDKYSSNLMAAYRDDDYTIFKFKQPTLNRVLLQP